MHAWEGLHKSLQASRILALIITSRANVRHLKSYENENTTHFYGQYSLDPLMLKSSARNHERSKFL